MYVSVNWTNQFSSDIESVSYKSIGHIAQKLMIQRNFRYSIQAMKYKFDIFPTQNIFIINWKKSKKKLVKFHFINKSNRYHRK